MLVTVTCEGGPCNGQDVTLRFPDPDQARGFVLVNRPQAQVIIYKVRGDRFVAGPVQTEIADRAAPKNRYRAALEPYYDVVAYDPEGMGPWPA